MNIQVGNKGLKEFKLKNPSMNGNLKNILNKESLKWIFVGGKGGVGKTTVSSCLSLLLAKKKKVLLISIDPAHNLSDAFNQKFSNVPEKVKGVENLYALEISEKENKMEIDNEMFKSIANLPGIDEAMALAEVVKISEEMNFDVIVIDTAPTGHALRFMSFPTSLNTLLNRFNSMEGAFPLIKEIKKIGLFKKIEEAKDVIFRISKVFTNKDLCNFICVCIPEFLSVYETNRLIDKLTALGINITNIVVNRILDSSKSMDGCVNCEGVMKIQGRYLKIIEDAFCEDFDILCLGMQREEVRGVVNLEKFGNQFLLE